VLASGGYVILGSEYMMNFAAWNEVGLWIGILLHREERRIGLKPFVAGLLEVIFCLGFGHKCVFHVYAIGMIGAWHTQRPRTSPFTIAPLWGGGSLRALIRWAERVPIDTLPLPRLRGIRRTNSSAQVVGPLCRSRRGSYMALPTSGVPCRPV
jgi:hypothetical protein